jgi:hypothetical protein
MKYKFGDFEIEDINVSLIVSGFFTLICLGYLVYLYNRIGYEMSPELTIPLLFGIVFENNRLNVNKKMFSLKMMLAIIAGTVVTFFYSLSLKPLNHVLGLWPYFFIFFYALISAIYHDDKVTIKIGEGTTLLQSLSLIYWIAESDLMSLSYFFKILILIPVSMFCLFSMYNAFTYNKLTKRARLILSNWSSVIMFVFAIVYIYRVYHYNQFSTIFSLSYIIGMLQYFLLGISIIYIVQNARMIYWYIPSKYGYDDEHKKKIKHFNTLHVGRYSFEQIKVNDAILITLTTKVLFSVNFAFDILPEFTLIWLVFWSTPFVMYFKNKILQKN